MHKNCGPKESAVSEMAKISKNIHDTFHVVSGIVKNMEASLNKPPNLVGKLRSLKFVEIKLSQ